MKLRYCFHARLLSSTCLLLPAYGGIMSDSFDVQTYRDFAENRGIFAINAKNVTIYDKDGKYIGVIPRMMNFDGVADAHAGEAALVGGPGFIATVAHDYSNSDITFAARFGAVKGTAFYDSYHSVQIKNGWGNVTNYTYDYRVQRLSKVVTEAEYAPYLTDSEYLDNMAGRLVLRVGSGTQTIATGQGKETTVTGGYAYLTGGMLRFDGQASVAGTGTENPDDPKSYPAYRFWYTYGKPSETNPLPIGIRAGDSGSPSYVFNEKSGKWEWVGAGQSGGGSGYGAFSQMRSGNQWASAYVDSFNRTVSVASGGGDVLWNATDAAGKGTITQGDSRMEYIGLASGLRGDTSTAGGRASDSQLAVCSNLIFDGSGGTIVVQGPIDTGAGVITFNRDYVLSGGNAGARLNTAGFDIAAGATLTTLLTGVAGDEWRKVGGGNMIVAGHGNNAADINIGGGGTLVLNRDGYAARNVKLNGGQVVVRLEGADQISGQFIFGHRGGMVDMYGHDLSLAAVTHLDSGAMFANTRAGSVSTLTFTGSGVQNYLGMLMDNGSQSRGLMNVVYNPGTAAGSVWNISGMILNSGTWTIQAGEVRVAGVHTLHAGGYVDEDDWTQAVFGTGTVLVKDGARFTAGAHALVGADVNVADGGAYSMLAGGSHSGVIALNGTRAVFLADVGSLTAEELGKISGSGSILKIGGGTLVLANGGSDFTGASRIDAGRVQARSAGALGAAMWTVGAGGAISVDGSDFSVIAGRVDKGSAGTFALTENRSTVTGLTGFHSLSLGAVGKVAVGDEGTSSRLDGWTADGGWALGGGGGTLAMNLKLSGTGTLQAGNGANSGTVILTNIHNSDVTGGGAFTGKIEVNRGTRLEYSDVRALGLAEANVRVNEGAVISAGASVDALLPHIDRASGGILLFKGEYVQTLDLASMGLGSIHLGADGQAVLSGAVKAGTRGYLFGGNGALTVSSALGGSHALTVDTQNMGTGGSVILTGDNSYTGGTGILNGATLVVGDGGLNGTLGSGNIVNNGTLAVNRAGQMVLASTVSGSGSLVKDGSGVLQLLGGNTYAGGTTIKGGTLMVGNGGSTGSLGAGAVVNNGVLAFNRSNDVVINTNVTGSGSLMKNGAGSLTVQKRLAYGGGTTVNEGALVLMGGGADGIIKGALTINARGTVNLKGGDSLGYSGGANSVTQIAVNGGTLYFGDRNNQTFQNTVFNLTGAVVDGVDGGRMDIWTNTVVNVKASDRTTQINHINVQLRDSRPTVFNVERGSSAVDLSVQANVINSSGVTGSLTKTGSGIMSLSGKNSYSGGTIVNGGVLIAASNQSLGTWLTTVNAGGRLALGGLGAAAPVVTLGNNILVRSGGVMSGSAILTRTATFEVDAVLEFTLTMGGIDGRELVYNNLMLQGGSLDIEDGARLALNALTLNYADEFWGTSRILNLVEGTAASSVYGSFTLDAARAGDYAAYGTWNLLNDAEGKKISMVWTPNAEPPAKAATDAVPSAARMGELNMMAAVPAPEPSSAMLVLLASGVMVLRRRTRRQ